MIYISKDLWSLSSLCYAYGSSFPRAVVLSLIGLSFAATWQFVIPTSSFWDPRAHPYPYAPFAFAVGFILVFRNNLAYQRFWEGRTQMQLMDSKWIDVATQGFMFEKDTLKKNATREERSASMEFCEVLCHLMSLLHAVALQNLRRDWDLRNLVFHNTELSEPTMDIQTRREMKHRAGRALLEKKKTGLFSRFAMHLWSGRFGFSTDIFHIRSARSEREVYNHMLPLGVIGGMTSEEKGILGEFVTAGTMESGDVSYFHAAPVYTATGQLIPGPGERIHVVNDWIHTLIMDRRRAGGLNIPAPILTRMFSIMSQGMEGYENCRKLADTPFPFPYAQLVMGMLIMFMVAIPFMFDTFIKASVLSLLLNFITLMSYLALNELAKDMEDPFIFDPNDLPLVRHHYDFNERLLAVANTRRPPSTFDLSPGTLIKDLRTQSPDELIRRTTPTDSFRSTSQSRNITTFTGGKLSHFLRCRSKGTGHENGAPGTS